MAGEGNKASYIYFAYCGHLGQGTWVSVGVVCQMVEARKSTPLFFSLFLGGSWTADADVQAFRQIRLILCQVRQGCFWRLFFQHGTGFPPPLSCLAGLLPWSGWAGGRAKDSVRANDKCNSV